MPVYSYKAYTDKGQISTGVIDADSPRDARLKLKHLELYVIELNLIEEEEGRKRFHLEIPLITAERRTWELSILTRQLATLLYAGLPLAQALSAVIEQCERKDIEAVLRSVREKIIQGQSFATSLSKHPRFFDTLYVNMVKAGEASGNLDQVLLKIADYLQTQNRIRNKVIAALTYPAIIVVIGIAVVTFLLSVVVPKILNILVAQGKALPLPTEILLNISNFVRGYWWMLIIFVVSFFVVLRLIILTEKGKYFYDMLLLKLPLVGNVIKKQAISRFANTFATLLESGLSVMESLEIVKKVVNNVVLMRIIQDIQNKVLAGADISTSLKKNPIFPSTVTYMIAVGEESGQLETLLRKISSAYDEEVDITTQRLISMLEPLMIVIMAGFVGFIIMAILLPILEFSKIR